MFNKFMMQWRTRYLSAVLVAGLMATGCGAADDASPAGAEASAANEADGEIAELELWTFLDPTDEDPRGTALTNVVESFNETNPDVHVTVVNHHYTKLDNEVLRATAAGAGPDIVNVFNAQLGLHTEAGTVQPLDEFAEEWLKTDGSDYVFPLDAFKVGGNLMAIPWEARVRVLAYRADLLKDLGLEPPKTLDELREVAIALDKHLGDEGTAFTIPSSEAGLGSGFTERFNQLVLGFGGQLFDADGSPAFHLDGGPEALDYIRSFVEAGVMDRQALSVDADQMTTALGSGTLAMAMEGSHRIGGVRSNEGIGDNLATMPVPGVSPDTLTPTVVQGQTFGIGVNTPHPEAAWRFIEHHLSAESQILFAEAGVIPVRSSVFEHPDMSALENAEELQVWSDYLAEYGVVETLPAEWNEIAGDLVVAGQRVIFEGADAQESLTQVADKFQQ